MDYFAKDIYRFIETIDCSHLLRIQPYEKKINLFCFYIPCNAFVDDDACQLYVQQFLILKNKKIYIYLRVNGW